MENTNFDFEEKKNIYKIQIHSWTSAMTTGYYLMSFIFSPQRERVAILHVKSGKNGSVNFQGEQ